jgi:hypothetical protein
MRRRALCFVTLLALVGLCPRPASAQWIVHDPANLAEAVATFQQLVQHYALVLQQTRRLPLNLAARYRVPALPWLTHGAVADYAGPLLDALNRGDAAGAKYLQTVAGLDPIRHVMAHVPADLQGRLGTAYATIELADRVARTAVHQAGVVRTNGPFVLQTIQALEDDAVSGDDRFHTQAALLNKINGASVLGLRIAAETHQSLLGVVEQLVVSNKRQRDSEAKLMDAQLYQWQYGRPYGDDLVSRTAAALDGWRQP